MPVTTTALAILAAGNTAMNYFGARQQATAAQKEGEYGARIYEGNASVADQQAKDALAIGADQESRHAAAVRGLIGEQRAGFAASGVDISSGSAQQVQEESALLGELDRATIANNARREAWGYNVEATDFRNKASLSRAGGANAAQGYRNQGYSTLIGGAVQQAGLWKDYQSTPSTPKASTPYTPRPTPPRLPSR